VIQVTPGNEIAVHRTEALVSWFAQRDFPPLALTFFHRALAAADIFARAAALIFRLRLGLFGIGPVFAKDSMPKI
jgi:hypothetical protein